MTATLASPPMMLQTPTPSPLWLEILRSPATVLAALALCVRWVVAPALSTYTRHELQSELKQLAQFPLFVDRVERIEGVMQSLASIPEALARIEEQVKALHDDRHDDRTRKP